MKLSMLALLLLFVNVIGFAADVYMGDQRARPEKIKRMIEQAEKIAAIDVTGAEDVPAVKSLIQSRTQLQAVKDRVIVLGTDPSGGDIRAALVQVLRGDMTVAHWTTDTDACNGWSLAEADAVKLCGVVLNRGMPRALSVGNGVTIQCRSNVADPEQCGKKDNQRSCSPWVHVVCP